MNYSTLQDLDNAYKNGEISKHDYYRNYYQIKQPLDKSDDILSMLDKKEMGDRLDALDRAMGKTDTPNNFADLYKDEVASTVALYALLGVGAVTIAYAPLAIEFAKGTAPIALAFMARQGRQVSKLATKIMNTKMPQTLAGNVALAVGANMATNAICDAVKQPKDDKSAKLAFEIALNKSGLSKEDKEFFLSMFSEQKQAIDAHGKVLLKFSETMESFINDHREEKQQQRKQKQQRERIETYQNTLIVISFIAHKIDPELGRTVSTIGSVALNIGVKLASGITKLTFGFAMGLAVALLPLFDLFSNREDIDQKRHEEIMNALKAISEQIAILHQEMHKRFNLVHEHLTIIQRELGEYFFHTFKKLEQIMASLGDVASAINAQQNWTERNFGEIHNAIHRLENAVYTLHQDDWKIKLNHSINNLDLHHAIQSSSIIQDINNIFNHLSVNAYSDTFTGISPFNVYDLVSNNVLWFMRYACVLAGLNRPDLKIPNLIEFCNAADKLIYCRVLFKDVENIATLCRLNTVKEQTKTIQQNLKKATSKSLIENKSKEYVDSTKPVVQSYLNCLKAKSDKYLKVLNLPCVYSAVLNHQPLHVNILIEVNASKPSETPQHPIVLFKQNDNYMATGFDDKNIISVLEGMGMLKVQYGIALTKEEKIKHKVPEQSSAYWITLHFLESSFPDLPYPLGELTYPCIGTIVSFKKKDVYCLDITDLHTCISQALKGEHYRLRGEFLYAKRELKDLTELNFIQLLYLPIDSVISKVKQIIPIEALRAMKYTEEVKQFEQKAADLLLLSSLNRVCTNPLSVYANNTPILTDKTDETGYLIDYSDEIYTLHDLVYYTQALWKEISADKEQDLPAGAYTIDVEAEKDNDSNHQSDSAEKVPNNNATTISKYTRPIIDELAVLLEKHIEDKCKQVIDNLGDPNNYCCPPILQQMLHRLEECLETFTETGETL